MKFSSALFLISVVVLGVRTLSAQKPKYFEVGKTLTLEIDPSAVSKPITSISWKHGSSLVVDWNTPNFPAYFGSFNGRTTLDPETLQLKIDPVTLADKGAFSLETNAGPIVAYQVEVYKPPPQPIIKTRPLVCGDSCHLHCAVDNQDLGPITYEWKMDGGEWTEGDEQKSISRSSNTTANEFFCRLITRVGTSEASVAFENPFHKPAKYFEVGKTLTLEIDPPADSKPISSIRWKFGSSLVVDWNAPNFLTYYGSFNGRTTLDPETLQLKIDPLTLADSGSFSLETNAGSIVIYQVEVYKPPPQPIIKIRPLVCGDSCHLHCAVDNQDLGPITYEWKMDGGEWTEGDEQKSTSRSSNTTANEFFCRVITRVGTSEASAAFKNPFHKPASTCWTC